MNRVYTHTGECPNIDDTNTIEIDYNGIQLMGQPLQFLKANFRCKYSNDCSFRNECPIYQEAPKCLD